MKKIDIEKLEKAVLRKKGILDWSALKPIVDQLAEDDKCEECDGLGQVIDPHLQIPFEDANEIDCPSCHGSGTKPDQVLEVLDKIKVGLDKKWDEILRKAEDLTFDNFRGEGLSMALDVVRELEQQRKKELGNENRS